MGFFKKMMNSDIFVYFDDVNFVKNNFYNRNKILTINGDIWLTVPVLSGPNSMINDVKIDNSKNWVKKHQKSILYNYSKAPYFHEMKDFIEQLYQQKFELLIDLNMKIIRFIAKQLEIKTKTIFSSELKISETGSKRILEICKSLKTDHYISGTVWAKELKQLSVEDFRKHKIPVQFQEFQHPTYRQLQEDFVPFMSIIDLIFNEGKKKAKQILLNSSTKNSFAF